MLARDAYVWGLAVEFMNRFSRFQELVGAPRNTLNYGSDVAAWNNKASNAGDAAVLYINAIFDFNASGQKPLVLTVPPTTGQFYEANLLDNFVNGIGSIGNRTTPTTRSTSYLLVPPGSPWQHQKSVQLGGHTFPVLASDTNLNWLLIRIRANALVPASDPSSLSSVNRSIVQKFAINSLQEFRSNDHQPVYPKNYASPTPTAAEVQDSQQWASAPTESLPFFQQMGESLVYSPLPPPNTGPSGTPIASVGPWCIPQSGAGDVYVMPAVGQEPTLARFAPIGLTASGFKVPSNWGSRQMDAFNAGFRAGVRLVERAATAGKANAGTNYWSTLNSVIGTYPNTAEGYLTRSIVVLDGGSANVPLDAVYPTITSNVMSGTQLDGNNTCSITFTQPQTSYPSSAWPDNHRRGWQFHDSERTTSPTASLAA